MRHLSLDKLNQVCYNQFTYVEREVVDNMKNTAKFKSGYDKHGKWRMFDKMIRTTTKKKPIVTEKGLVLWGKAKEEK